MAILNAKGSGLSAGKTTQLFLWDISTLSTPSLFFLSEVLHYVWINQYARHMYLFSFKVCSALWHLSRQYQIFSRSSWVCLCFHWFYSFDLARPWLNKCWLWGKEERSLLCFHGELVSSSCVSFNASLSCSVLFSFMLCGPFTANSESQ